MVAAEDPDRYAEAFDAALAMAEQAGVWELDARIATVLAGLGLANVPLETTLGDMSGGQRRRFALAALLLRPVDAMVLDEPTNHLDDDGVDFLIRELEEFSGPVLVASHDRFFLDKAADSLVDLDPGLGHEGGGVLVAPRQDVDDADRVQPGEEAVAVAAGVVGREAGGAGEHPHRLGRLLAPVDADVQLADAHEHRGARIERRRRGRRHGTGDLRRRKRTRPTGQVRSR